MSEKEIKCKSCGWENNTSNTSCYFCGCRLIDEKERKIKRIWGRK